MVLQRTSRTPDPLHSGQPLPRSGSRPGRSRRDYPLLSFWGGTGQEDDWGEVLYPFCVVASRTETRSGMERRAAPGEPECPARARRGDPPSTVLHAPISTHFGPWCEDSLTSNPPISAHLLPQSALASWVLRPSGGVGLKAAEPAACLATCMTSLCPGPSGQGPLPTFRVPRPPYQSGLVGSLGMWYTGLSSLTWDTDDLYRRKQAP